AEAGEPAGSGNEGVNGLALVGLEGGRGGARGEEEKREQCEAGDPQRGRGRFPITVAGAPFCAGGFGYSGARPHCGDPVMQPVGWGNESAVLHHRGPAAYPVRPAGTGTLRRAGEAVNRRPSHRNFASYRPLGDGTMTVYRVGS